MDQHDVIFMEPVSHWDMDLSVSGIPYRGKLNAEQHGFEASLGHAAMW